MDVFILAYLKSFKINVRLIYNRISCACRKHVAIEMSYSPIFHDILFNFNTTITGNAVVIDISFKTFNFKNLIKLLFVLTMFIQRADNLSKLMGTRIILTFSNWDHIVQ